MEEEQPKKARSKSADRLAAGKFTPCKKGHGDVGYYANGQCKDCVKDNAHAAERRRTIARQQKRAKDGVPNGHKESLYCQRGHLKSEHRENGKCRPCQAIEFQIWYERTYIPHPKPKKGEPYICKRGHNAISGKRCLPCNRILSQKRRDANPEQHRAHYAKWLKANPDKAKTATIRWQKENPDKIKVNHSNRHAAMRDAPGKLTAEEWSAILKKYKYTCQYCHNKFPSDQLTQDHVVPLQGADVKGTNFAFNIVPSCRPCNTSKNNRILPGTQHTLFDQFIEGDKRRKKFRSLPDNKFNKKMDMDGA
jgi:5-methylcytosine-specific restriction endonuclease McrA